MRFYELMYIADPSTEDGAESIKQKIEGIVTGREGSIISFEKLGKKRLAYPIAKRQYGNYNLVNIQGDGSIVLALETFLRLNSLIFRYIILVFSEKTVKLRTETKRIQNEEAERMRRGGRPMNESQKTKEPKSSVPTIEPITIETGSEEPEVEKVKVEEPETSIADVQVAKDIPDTKSSPPARDEKSGEDASDALASPVDDESNKKNVE